MEFLFETQMVQPTATIRTANTDTRLINKCCGVSQLGFSMTCTSWDVGSSRRKDLIVPSPLPSRRQMPRASMRLPIGMFDRKVFASDVSFSAANTALEDCKMRVV